MRFCGRTFRVAHHVRGRRSVALMGSSASEEMRAPMLAITSTGVADAGTGFGARRLVTTTASDRTADAMRERMRLQPGLDDVASSEAPYGAGSRRRTATRSSN